MNPLTVFPRHPSAPDTYYINGAWAPAAITAVDKRFTDAELAAELFRQTAWLGALGRVYPTDVGRNIVIEAAFTFGPITRDEYEWLTISQFAHRPHHDDGPA